MPKQKPPTGKPRGAGTIVGKAGFAKISAVEGIRLKPAMKIRAAEAAEQGLSAEQRRDRIIRAYRKA